MVSREFMVISVTSPVVIAMFSSFIAQNQNPKAPKTVLDTCERTTPIPGIGVSHSRPLLAKVACLQEPSIAMFFIFCNDPIADVCELTC